MVLQNLAAEAVVVQDLLAEVEVVAEVQDLLVVVAAELHLLEEEVVVRDLLAVVEVVVQDLLVVEVAAVVKLLVEGVVGVLLIEAGVGAGEHSLEGMEVGVAYFLEVLVLVVKKGLIFLVYYFLVIAPFHFPFQKLMLSYQVCLE